jgi:hypothetical protein
MKWRAFVLAIALAFALVACPTPSPQAIDPSIQTVSIGGVKEPVVKLELTGSYLKGETLNIKTTISSPTESTVTLYWLTAPYVELNREKLVITLKAGETKEIKSTAKLTRRGFYDITLSTSATNWEVKEPVGTRFAFNVISSLERSKGETGGETTVQNHLEQLPTATKTTYLEQEKDRLIKQDIVPLEHIQDGITREVWNGQKGQNTTIQDTDKYNSVFVPEFGAGTPHPGELDGTPETLSQDPRIQARRNQPQKRNWCGDTEASVRFVINSPSYTGNNGYAGYDLKNMKVTIYDNNGFWGNWVIAQGFTDEYGIFRYRKPLCDTWWWFDWTPPDLIYEITGTTSYGLESRVGGLINNVAMLTTGTFWEETTANRLLPINAPSFEHTKAFWVTNVMIAQAMEANVLAGNGASFFPLRVANSSFSTFAPVAYIHFNEAFGYAWDAPYPVIHEFGHEIMWNAANQLNYFQAYANRTELWSPGYMDDYCYPYLIAPIAGWIAAVNCWLTVYNHDPTNAYDPRLAWNEGFANYYNQVMFLYLWKKNSGESKYGDYFKSYQMQAYCGHISTTNPPYTFCDAALGQGNENRVSTFLYRYTTEVLAEVVAPSKQPNSFFNWSNNLSLGDSLAILRAYGRVRGSLANYGYSRTLFQAWSDKLKVLAPSGSNTKICEIALETGFLAFNGHPFPCNSSGVPTS